MTEKTILKWLEKLFEREIEISLDKENKIYPLQIPKKQSSELLELSLVEEKVIQKQDRFGMLNFTFHRLSDLGRMKYCFSCKGGVE